MWIAQENWFYPVNFSNVWHISNILQILLPARFIEAIEIFSSTVMGILEELRGRNSKDIHGRKMQADPSLTISFVLGQCTIAIYIFTLKNIIGKAYFLEAD